MTAEFSSPTLEPVAPACLDKRPKFTLLTIAAVGGWLLPLAMDFSQPIAGFSLALAFGSTVATALETRKEAQVGVIAQAHQALQMERVVYEMTLRHEQELQELKTLYGFGDEFNEELDDAPPPQLPGGHIHQPVLKANADHPLTENLDTETSEATTGTLETFDLDWLLRSPNLHLLITGDTGDGKTTLTRWIAQQFNAQQGKVYDPDYDGSNWGFPAISAPLEDYTEIRAHMRIDLQEFEQRKPNDPANPKTVFIVEEMPSTIPECAEDGEKWLKLLLRRGRKRNLFVIGVSQDRNADSFKLKSAGVLSNFTVIYLGGYGEQALDRVRNKSERHHIRTQLRQFSRPALVQFKGRFYPWDIPELSNFAESAPKRNHFERSFGQTEPKVNQADNTSDPIALLNRSLQAKNTNYTDQHYEILVWVRSQTGQSASARDIQRHFKITTAEETKTLLHDLQCLEFGECQQDVFMP